MDQEIIVLFQKYLSGNLTQAEIARMRKIIAKTDNSLLDGHIEQLWNDYSLKDERNQQAFDTISGNLQKTIYPKKQHSIGFYLLYSGKG